MCFGIPAVQSYWQFLFLSLSIFCVFCGLFQALLNIVGSSSMVILSSANIVIVDRLINKFKFCFFFFSLLHDYVFIKDACNFFNALINFRFRVVLGVKSSTSSISCSKRFSTFLFFFITVGIPNYITIIIRINIF